LPEAQHSAYRPECVIQFWLMHPTDLSKPGLTDFLPLQIVNGT